MVWILIQVVVNILMALGIFVLWSKLKKPPQDDPRLSKGLQLLQSKISVLEDLSDRTEVQFKQINSLMDEKLNQVRKKVVEASETIYKIDLSMQKSLEVAEIFQDKIPHEEIIERQNTAKYVKAAKMAHEGTPILEICEALDIPEAEVEFIAKVNKDELRFNEAQLPAWAFPETSFSPASENDGSSLKKLGDEFRKACADFDNKERDRAAEEAKINEKREQLLQSAKNMSTKIKDSAESVFSSAGGVAKSITREVSEKTEELSRELFNSLEGKSEVGNKEFLEDKTMDLSPKRVVETKASEPAPLSQQPTAIHHDAIASALDAQEPVVIEKKPAPKTHFVGGNPNEEKVVKKVIFPTVDMNNTLG